MTAYREYPPAPFGLGTQFPEQLRPPTYASVLENRFLNPGGGAEKRQAATVQATLTSGPDMTWVSEFVHAKGTSQVVMAGGSGVFRLDTSVMNTITTAHTGLDASAGIPRIKQSDDKLIVVNGRDRNIFSTDIRSFREMRALVITGIAEATATAHDRLLDADINNWVTQTEVAVNDLVFDSVASSYGLITAITSSRLSHTPMSAGAPGLASGNAAKVSGDSYEIHDLVELNIIPVSSQGGAVEFDNVAVAESGTSAQNVKVSGIHFGKSDVRAGDYIYNTTRNQVQRIESINVSSLITTEVCGQVCGDSLTFLKSAMPIAADIHQHYGRTYYLDARDRRKIRISGPLDAQDLTTDAGTLDSTTFKFGNQQPIGDEMLGMASYQQYFVVGGRRYILMFSGTNPIADTSADTSDFNPQALFPVGIASPDSLITIGNDLIWLGKQGMQSASLEGSDTLPTSEHLSENIRRDLQTAVSGAAEKDIKIVNYPKRQWVLCKVSNEQFVFNYSPTLGAAFQAAQDIGQGTRRGSWSRFTGLAARLNHYLVREDQSLVGVGTSGKYYRLDVEDSFADAGGSAYRTVYQTAWLGLDENARTGQPSRKQKGGVAILPQADTSAAVTYTIRATAPYDGESNDAVTVAISDESNPRIPFRWRGERVRLTFETSADEGPDILGPVTIAFNSYGVK